MKMNKLKRQLVLLLICVLLTGMPIIENSTVSKAVIPNLEEKTVRLGYGLNNPRTDSNGITTWDCVWFGNYWQEDTNGDGKADENDEKQPIKWRVLSVDGNDAFLLADKNLDFQWYNDTGASATWETCTMRSWLNGYGEEMNQAGTDYSGGGFLNCAFSLEEQSAIWITNVVNNDNSKYGTEGGNNTPDKVYLLSIEEAMNPVYGFTTNVEETRTRTAMNTFYASQGIHTSSGGLNDDWWLRSPGNNNISVSYVDAYGYVNRYGHYVDYFDRVVRPVLHLNLSFTTNWSNAGTVSVRSEDESENTAVPTASVTPMPVIPSAPPSVNPSPTPGGSTTSPIPGGTSTPKPTTDTPALKEDSTLTITAEGNLTGILQNKNTVQEIRQQFADADLEIKDANGKPLTDSDLLGTGATVSVMDGATVKASCQVVLVGDINGDGKVNGKDVSMLARSLVGKATLTDAQKKAGEVFEDGKVNGKDVSKLAQSLVGKATISSQGK